MTLVHTGWLKSIFDLIKATTPLERLPIICWLRPDESTGSGKTREKLWKLCKLEQNKSAESKLH